MNKVYSRIESIVGSVITVRATNVAYGELAEIETVYGKSLAEVNKIDGDIVSLQVFAAGIFLYSFIAQMLQIPYGIDIAIGKESGYV